MNAAIIAGNRPADRVPALRRFWDLAATDPTPLTTAILGPPPPCGAWRRAYNDAAVMQALLFGQPGLFRPQPITGRWSAAPAAYDLTPLMARLAEVVDFDRLNAAGPRLTARAGEFATPWP